ncbi:MAG: hypothetical protein AAFV19_17160 [Pseudomonadota bacterium]
MQTPAQKYSHFKKHLKGQNSRFWKRTSSLRGLCDELERQVSLHKRQGTRPTPFKDTQHAKSFCKNPTDARIGKYEYQLRRLVESWGKANDYHVESNIQRLIQSARATLDQCKGFACNDARNFRGSIHPRFTKAERDDLVARGMAKAAFAAGGFIPRGEDAAKGVDDTRWQARFLKATKDRVYSNGAGECTSYGLAAAHILSTVPFEGIRPRIEVVAWDSKAAPKPPGYVRKRFTTDPTHVYCIVGRKGGTILQPVGSRSKVLQHRLPSHENWGKDVWIVDPWLASLGWESCYHIDQHPKKGFLKYLFQKMDSYEETPVYTETPRQRGMWRDLPDWATEQVGT